MGIDRWAIFAAAVLSASVAVNLSTLLGFDPLRNGESVWWIHVLVLLPSAAAIYYGNKVVGKGSDAYKAVTDATPRWMRVTGRVFIIYGAISFILLFILNEGGNTMVRDGKYFLMNHGTIIRPLNEEEFHRHQAYVVLGFSGIWIIFSVLALGRLTGLANIKKRGT
jgi:hypothetical protein